MGERRYVAESGTVLVRFPNEDVGLNGAGSVRACDICEGVIRKAWTPLIADCGTVGLFVLGSTGSTGLEGTGGAGLCASEAPRFLLPELLRRPVPVVDSSSPVQVPSTQPLVPGSSSSMGAASGAMTPSLGGVYVRYRRLPQ